MKKFICMFMILSLCLTSFGCASVKKKVGEAVVTNIVEHHPEQIQETVRQVTKMMLKNAELTQDQYKNMVVFLGNCRDLCQNPTEYTLLQAQQLIDNLNDEQIQGFAVGLLNFVNKYIETEDSTDTGNKLAVLAIDGAIQAVNEKIDK